MGKLILIRHGHTTLNRRGYDERLRGWLDVPLDDEGLREAEETAERVASHKIEVIYSSDLKRAMQTSIAVSRTTKAPLIPTPELRPWNLGIFGGQLIREIVPFLKLLSDLPDIPAPAGESWNQFHSRYSRQLLSLLELAGSSDRTIAAVTHVRNFLAAPSVIEGSDRNKVPVTGGPKTGSIYLVEKIEGKWRLRTDQFEAATRTPFLARDAPAIDRSGYQTATLRAGI
jgi:broad specificity phosphatase PhoE